MFDQDSHSETCESTENPGASFEGIPHGQIQKISQEGSKNTYVIILSKDYLKSESSRGQTFSHYQTATKAKVVAQHPDVAHNSVKSDERDFDSPSGEVNLVRQKKLPHPPEDVKLNLSNIQVEEYDSNQSASKVFLQQESILTEHDSAVGLDSVSEYSAMDLHNSPDVNSEQYRKVGVEQHAFKKTSPLKLGEPCSKQAFTPFSQADKNTAKSIASVKHEPALKKTYTNVAVPLMGHSTKSISILPKTFSKAVPTFSSVSPITQKPTSQTSFIPINPASSPVSQAVTPGPFTSTPVTGETHRRVQQVKQDSASHRSVYIIPSPFNRQISSNTCTSYLLRNQSQTDTWSPLKQTPGFNNSSGFISGSSSLETPDASNSFDAEHVQQTERNYSPMDYKELYTEIHMSADGSAKSSSDCVTSAVQQETDEDVEELDLGLDTNSLDPSITSSQESEANEPAEKASLNKSLTNIHWLKGMQLKDDGSTSSSQQQQNMQWTHLSPEEIKAISKDCGRDKRPPFSYCSLIQMALCSREERKMMLKEICKWIEETFPYFRYTAKPGWRNSIRHNLSLYNIFEREPAKRHGSFWMLKSDVEPKTKQYHREKHTNTVPSSDSHRSMPTLPSQIPIIPVYSTNGQLSAVSPQTFSHSLQLPQNTASKKKGPPPILPRPSPYTVPQAYALIPIPSVNPSLSTPSPIPSQQQVLFNLQPSGQMSACPSPIISEVSAAVASIQVSSASPVPPEYFCDTKPLHKEHFYNRSVKTVKQAWLSCQSTETASSIDSPRSDVATSSDIGSSNEFTGRGTKSKRPRVKPGLPKPTMYGAEEQRKEVTGSKRRKLQQKARSFSTEYLDEDEEGVKFISNLEKEIFSRPSKSLEAEDVEHILTTSTPTKNYDPSSSNILPSPIGRFSPLRGSGLFDNSFLETLGDRKALGLSPDAGDRGKSPLDSPQLGVEVDDILDFNVLSSLERSDESPDHNNPNLSRILTECGIDPDTDNVDNFPNLNWSVVDQMVSNMDTGE